jgi:acetoin utilization deacetylase AcuC-like enzyme
VKVFWDEAQLQHAPRFFLQRGEVRPHYEVPDRALALLAGVSALGLQTVRPPEAPESTLELVHSPAYLAFLRTAHADWAAMPQAGPEVVANVHPAPEMLANGARSGAGVIARAGWFTADAACPIGSGTWQAALAAGRCALAAADTAAQGGTAYALVRPPGHHAYPARAGGHCYINNAALAAEHLRRSGAPRVAVLDIDSHHGNGTQGIFWDRDDVLFVSVHGDPAGYYPWYVGHADERGGGDGVGCNLNLPLARGSGDASWLEALETALAEIRHFGAEALVVSLGFDASEQEPLSYLAVTADGFARAAERIAGLRLPAAIVQEGGYNVDVIGGLLGRFLTAYGA